MKLVWISVPLLLLTALALGAKIAGRPLSRGALNALLALVLLGYFLVTAALGLFWVALMDLPAFDAHYLFGYATLVALLAHVALQVRPLAVQFRRLSPTAWLTPDRCRFRASVRALGALFLAAFVLVPLGAYGVGRFFQEPARLMRGASTSAATRTPSDEVWIMSHGERMSVVDWLYEATSYASSYRSPIRLREMMVEPPSEVKTYAGEPEQLPSPAARSGKALGALLSPVTPDEGALVRDRAPPLDVLGSWLGWSAGVTSRKAATAGLLLRAAASAGALYPVDVYVADASSIRYYDPHRHALARVVGDLGKVRLALHETSAARAAPLAFVLGATFDRTVQKYGARSYRYVTLDAGHVAANLLLAARASGFECVPEPWFDDALLLEAVGARKRDEGAMLVIGCSPHGKRSDRVPGHATVELPESTRGIETTRLSHQLTSWRLAKESSERPRFENPSAPPGSISLPSPQPGPAVDLYELIAKRRSRRETSRRPVGLAVLGDLLREAWAGAGLIGNDLVELHVIATWVSDLEPGVYRFFPEPSALALVRSGDFSNTVRSAGLDQEMFSDASFVLVWSLGRQGRESGARDFRAGLLEAGAGGQVAYLSAEARQLAICGVGAFEDDQVAMLLGDPAKRPVYLMAVGTR